MRAEEAELDNAGPVYFSETITVQTELDNAGHVYFSETITFQTSNMGQIPLLCLISLKQRLSMFFTNRGSGPRPSFWGKNNANIAMLRNQYPFKVTLNLGQNCMIIKSFSDGKTHSK